MINDVEKCKKGDKDLIQLSPLPHSSVVILIKNANKGGLEKYPQSKFWDQSQYCASSKCRGRSNFIFSIILKKRTVKEKNRKKFK